MAFKRRHASPVKDTKNCCVGFTTPKNYAVLSDYIGTTLYVGMAMVKMVKSSSETSEEHKKATSKVQSKSKGLRKVLFTPDIILKRT